MNKLFFLAKKALRKFNQYLYLIFNEIILTQKGRNFIILFNIRSLIIRSPMRVKKNSSFYLFRDKEYPSIKYLSKHERQASMSYHKGFLNRANSLAKDYCIDNIDFADDDLIIDCGANVGDFKLWFTLNNLKIRYLAFEPSPIEFSSLKQNLKNDTCYNIGLWNKESSLNFYISSEGADSSFFEPPKFGEKIQVKALPLRNFISEKVKLLKLEAEGGEPEILEGLGDKIKFIEYIAADVGFERGLKQESTLAQTTNYLLKKGFEVVSVARNRFCILYRNQNI